MFEKTRNWKKAVLNLVKLVILWLLGRTRKQRKRQVEKALMAAKKRAKSYEKAIVMGDARRMSNDLDNLLRRLRRGR